MKSSSNRTERETKRTKDDGKKLNSQRLFALFEVLSSKAKQSMLHRTH
jgi:hypothetical protein